MSAFLEFSGLHKSFGANRVLRGVDLTVERGETIVIMGASGSGKSVLLKHAIGLLKPDSGRVVVDGEDVTDFSERQWEHVRRRISMVFQSGALFDSMTVGENVAFPLREHAKMSEAELWEKVVETLALVGLHDVERMMPSDLSGGMRRRVSLARAIVLGTECILFDEPTTGLDPVTSNTINDLILKTQRALNCTSIIVTHDLVCTFKVADRIAYLHEGRMVFTGTRDEARRSGLAVMHEFITGGEPGGGYERILQY